MKESSQEKKYLNISKGIDDVKVSFPDANAASLF